MLYVQSLSSTSTGSTDHPRRCQTFGKTLKSFKTLCKNQGVINEVHSWRPSSESGEFDLGRQIVDQVAARVAICVGTWNRQISTLKRMESSWMITNHNMKSCCFTISIH